MKRIEKYIITNISNNVNSSNIKDYIFKYVKYPSFFKNKENLEIYMNYYLENIDDLSRISIEILKFNEEVNKNLFENNIYTLSQLALTPLLVLSKFIDIKDAIEVFKKIDPVYLDNLLFKEDALLIKTNKVDKLIILDFNKEYLETIRVEIINKELKIENERYLKILENRLSGLTLNETGQKYGVTRERVRQIESKYLKSVFTFFRKDIFKAFFDKFIIDNNYVFEEDICSLIIHYRILFRNFLKMYLSSNYVEELGLFLIGEDWTTHLEELTSKLPEIIYYEDIDNYINDFKKSIYSLYNKNIENDILKKYVLKEFHDYSKLYSKIELSKSTKYKMVLEKYFPNGIKVHNKEALDLFKKKHEELFSENIDSYNNNSIRIRIVETCHLIDKGTYATYLSYEKLEQEFINKIKDYINSNDKKYITNSEIYSKFEKEFNELNINNKYICFSVLKRYINNKFVRNYLIK